MKKNHIFSFVFSAAVLATTSLLAMDQEPENNSQPKQLVVHTCPLCNPAFQKDETFPIPREVIQEHILGKLSLQELMAVSQTSKTMHNTINWKAIGEKEESIIFPGVCLKECITGLLGSKKRTYTIPLPQLSVLMGQVIVDKTIHHSKTIILPNNKTDVLEWEQHIRSIQLGSRRFLVDSGTDGYTGFDLPFDKGYMAKIVKTIGSHIGISFSWQNKFEKDGFVGNLWTRRPGWKGYHILQFLPQTEVSGPSNQ